MMDRTDRFYRLFARRLTRRTLLYSEMITAAAIVHGDRDHLLGKDEGDNPVVLQLGGDDPTLLAEATRIAADYGYDEVNLNCGCPSERVQSGSFGVVLMGRPDHVARCVEAMRLASPLPVGVKHRIGFDELDRYEDMLDFVDRVAAAGCDRLTVHARKAWTQGLSPRENREIPPLRHDDVWRLKHERPELLIEINGGIRDLDATSAHLAHVDGVMIGRAAWDDPWILADADRRLYGEAENPAATRIEAARAMLPHIERRLTAGDRLHHLLRPMLNLFLGQPGGRRFRRILSEGHHQPGADAGLLERAIADVEAIGANHLSPGASFG
ncbi:MAG: tRNA dihydrouridine(20/20a) synthase DusA [Deltaproteobacteria bacterium]|nr:tRNA dihydrouridine(20/20a) synthase DusA [Deltaproteobacteria bacterium]